MLNRSKKKNKEKRNSRPPSRPTSRPSSKPKRPTTTTSLKSSSTTVGLKDSSAKKRPGTQKALRKKNLKPDGKGNRDRTKSYGGNIYDVYEAPASATAKKDYLNKAQYASAGHAAQSVVVYDRNGRRIEFDWDRKYWDFKRKFRYGQALELLKKRIKELEPMVKRAIQDKSDELLEEYELETQVIYDRLADLRVVSPSREIPVVKKRAKNLLDSIKQARAELMHTLEEEERKQAEAARRRKEDALRSDVEELERQVDAAISGRDVPRMNKLQNMNLPEMVNRLKQFADRNGDSLNIENMIDDCESMDERLTQAIQQCKEEDVLAEELEHLRADSENAIEKGDVKRMTKCERNCDDLLQRLQKRQPRSEKVNEMIEDCKDLQSKLNNGKVLQQLKKMCDSAVKSGDLTQMKKCKSEIEARSTGGNADAGDMFYPLKQQIDTAINKALKGLDTKCDELKEEIDKTIDDSIGGANSRFDPSIHDGYANAWNKAKISEMSKFKNTEIVPLYEEIVKQKDASHNYDSQHPRSNFDNFEQQELSMANKLADLDSSVYNYIQLLKDDLAQIEENEKVVAKRTKELRGAFDKASASKDPGRMEMIQNEILAAIEKFEPLRKTSPKIEENLNKLGEWSDKLDSGIEREKIRIAKEAQDEAQRKKIEAEEAQLRIKLEGLTKAAKDAIESGDLEAMKKAAKDLSDFSDELRNRNPITQGVNDMLKDLNNVANELQDAIKAKEREIALLKDVADIEADVNEALESKDIPRIKAVDNRVRQIYNKFKDEPQRTPKMTDALNKLADMSDKLHARVKELEKEEADLKAKEQEFEQVLNQLVDDAENAMREEPKNIKKMKEIEQEIEAAVQQWEPVGDDLNSKKIKRGVRDLKKTKDKLGEVINQAEADQKEEEAFTEAVKGLTDDAEKAIEGGDTGDIKDVQGRCKILIDEWKSKQPKSEQVKKNLKDLGNISRDLDAALKKQNASANDFTRRVNELKDDVDAALAADPRKINVMEGLNDEVKDLIESWRPKASACTDPDMKKLLNNNLRTLDTLGQLLDDAIDEARQREKEEKELTDLVNSYRDKVDAAEAARDIPAMEALEKDLKRIKTEWKDKKGESDVFNKNLDAIDDMLDSLAYKKKLFNDEDEFTRQLRDLKAAAKDAKKSGDLPTINKAKSKAQRLLDEWEPKKDESKVVSDGVNDIYDILIDLNAEADRIKQKDQEQKEAQAKRQREVEDLTKRVQKLKPEVNDAIERRDVNNMVRLRDDEVEALLNKWSGKKGEDPAIRRAVDDLENMLEALQGCIDDERALEEELIQRVQELSDATKNAVNSDEINIDALQELKDEIKDLITAWEPKTQTSSNVAKPVATLKNLAQTLDRAIEDWKNNVDDFVARLKELERGVARGRKEFNRTKLQRLEGEIDALQSEWKPKKDALGKDAKEAVENGLDTCDALKDGIRRTLREMDGLEGDIAQLKMRGKDAIASSSDADVASDGSERLTALIEEIDDLLARWEPKKQDSEWVTQNCGELQDLRKKLERVVSNNEKKKLAQEQEFAKRLETLKQDAEKAIEKDKKRGEVKFMLSAQDDVDAYIKDIKRAMRNSGDKGASLRPLQDEAMELSDSLERAIDALRDRLDEEEEFEGICNQLIDDADDAMQRESLNKMQHVRKGMDQAINAWKDRPSMQESRRMQKSLKRLKEKARELDRAIEDAQSRAEAELEEKKREAAEKARAAQELEDLKQKVADLEKEVEQAVFDEDVNYMRELGDEIEDLINKFKDVPAAKSQVRKLKNMQRKLDDKLQEVEDGRKRREELENAFDKFVEGFKDSVAAAVDAHNRRKMSQLQKDAEQWETKIKDLQGNYTHPERTKKNLKRLAKLQQKLQDAIGALNDMDEDLDHLEQVCKELKQETRESIKKNEIAPMEAKKLEIEDLIQQWDEWAQDPPVKKYRTEDISRCLDMLRNCSKNLDDALQQKQEDEEAQEKARIAEEERRREQERLDKEIRKLEKQTREYENQKRDLRRRDFEAAQRLKEDVDDLRSRWEQKLEEEPKFDVPRVQNCLDRLELLSNQLERDIKKWREIARMKEEERKAKAEKLAREQEEYKAPPRVEKSKDDGPFDIVKFLDELEPKVDTWEQQKHQKYEWLDDAIKADKILQEAWGNRRDHKDALKKAYGSPYTKLQTLRARVSALVSSKTANFRVAFEVKKDNQGRQWFDLKILKGAACEKFRADLDSRLRDVWRDILDTMDPVDKLVSNITTQASSGKLNVEFLGLSVDNDQRSRLLEKIHEESDTDVNGNVIHTMSQTVKNALEASVPEGVNQDCEFNGYFEIHMNTAEATF